MRENSGLRRAATLAGAKTYVTGLACKNGHIAPKYTDSATCVECTKSKTSRWQKTPKGKECRLKASRKWAGLPEPTRPCPDTCESCGKPPKSRKLHLDHNYVTGRFRGWLCGNCNLGVGNLGDNLEGVERMASYLRRAEAH